MDAASMRTAVRLALVAALGLAVPAVGPAQEAEEGGCVYDRRVYPPGSERCQDGTRVRCAEGAWEDIGFCEAEPQRPPLDAGGDVVEDPD